MKTTAVHNSATQLPHQAPNPDGACCRAESLPPAPDEAQVVVLTERLKALADESRLRMLDLLSQHGDALCVCEITEQFDLRQPTISHHLRLLREAALIRGERRGTWMYYSATDEGRRCMSLVRTLV